MLPYGLRQYVAFASRPAQFLICMKIDVDVRDITGGKWTFSSQPDSTVKNFRRQVQERFGGKVKLLFNVGV